MHRSLLPAVLLTCGGGLAVLAAQDVTPQPVRGVTSLAITSQQLSELRTWDARIDTLRRTGELGLRKAQSDTVLEGAAHERYDQYFRGVRVFGGDVTRQLRRGVTESIFGTVHSGIAISPDPTFSEDDARAALSKLSTAGEFPAQRSIELVVLPTEEGTYRLTWRAHVWSEKGWMHTFLDAHTGTVVLQYNDLQTQSAVGTGTGVLGDSKKISTRSLAGRYYADDELRPPVLITYDMQGNLFRTETYLDGLYTPATGDVANDDNNVWTDAANVDAHVHLGWTYDYYFRRFGRRGLDDRDAPVYAVTHPVRRSDLETLPESAATFVINAFWCGGCGPSGQGAMVFGEGLPPGYVLTASGQTVDYMSGALDVVSHELTHGLTEYSSNLHYRNESGALNESFSDMLAVGAEFQYQTAGSGTRQADYLIGEDVIRPGGVRSLANPGAFGDPDHYSQRFRGPEDFGGVHINSGIPNHAFYLAIEGGTNRTSGLAVQGVGAANREQIEKVFYRAFVYLLTSDATFSSARAATIQSARDLYGSGSPAERAVVQAWTAVGVN